MISDAQAVEMMALDLVDDRLPLVDDIAEQFVAIVQRYQELTGHEVARGSNMPVAVLRRAGEIDQAGAAEMKAIGSALQPEWSRHPDLSAEEMVERIGRHECERRLAKTRRGRHN